MELHEYFACMEAYMGVRRLEKIKYGYKKNIFFLALMKQGPKKLFWLVFMLLSLDKIELKYFNSFLSQFFFL